jgi:hypothetical protein
MVRSPKANFSKRQPPARTQDTIIYVPPPFPTAGERDHPPLRGRPRRPTRATTKETKPPNPPPVGKAGFEVWVFTKGGLVSVHYCRLCRTVVHAHLVRVCTSGPRVRACIGMVRSPKAKLSYQTTVRFSFRNACAVRAWRRGAYQRSHRSWILSRPGAPR